MNYFQIEKIIVDDEFDKGSKTDYFSKPETSDGFVAILRETINNTKRLFSTSLYAITLKMIYINFSIAFG